MFDPPVAYSPEEFHRRRAEMEIENALSADKPSVAVAHLELARMHRERRNRLVAEHRATVPLCPPRVVGTDKEG